MVIQSRVYVRNWKAFLGVLHVRRDQHIEVFKKWMSVSDLLWRLITK